MSSKTTLHCWQSRNDWLEKHDFDTYAAEFFENKPDCCCMLPDGHDGPHEWTPNDEIVVSFAAKAARGWE